MGANTNNEGPDQPTKPSRIRALPVCPQILLLMYTLYQCIAKAVIRLYDLAGDQDVLDSVTSVLQTDCDQCMTSLYVLWYLWWHISATR